jgi:hypothetical protein
MTDAADLSSQIPELDGDGALCDFSHVESHSWDHVFVESPGRQDVHQRRLPNALESNEGKLHLLFEEEAANPNKPVNSVRVGPVLFQIIIVITSLCFEISPALWKQNMLRSEYNDHGSCQDVLAGSLHMRIPNQGQGGYRVPQRQQAFLDT